MSNHVAYKRWLADCGKTLPGDFWYVLKSKTGKVRDWIPAKTAKEARRLFQIWRLAYPLWPTFTVERRGKVEHE